MNIEKIKPIPNYIAKIIRAEDEKFYDDGFGCSRFYAYFAKLKDELVKITVACKHYKGQWFCKQVAVHGVHSDKCYVKDMEYSIMGYRVGWYSHGLTDQCSFYENGKWCAAEDKYYDPAAKVVNKKFALKFDAFKYSVIDKYPYTNVFKYLHIYEQFPHVEYFMKLGLHHLATNKTLLRKTGNDKNFRRWIVKYAKQLRNDYGNLPYFSAKVILASYKSGMPLIETQIFEREKKELSENYTYTHSVNKVIKPDEIGEFLTYLKKQNITVNSYDDYLKACLYLKLDMSIPKNRYPHDFKRWHDIRTDEYSTAKAMADEKERAELYEKFNTVAQKYEGLQYKRQAAFIMLIPNSPADLIREGDRLSHCVGRMGYDQKFAREETLIFFVRNIAEPDEPFVTIEYSLKKHEILQCHGYGNSKPDDSVLHFVNKQWLPYANRKLNKILNAA